MNSIHEVVLKNRLEQFKKRQREEAAKQQQELENKIIAQGEAATFGGDMHADGGNGEEYEDDADDEDDFIEDYSRSMSPGPLELKTLGQEDRRLPVVSEQDFKRAIVCLSLTLAFLMLIISSKRGERSLNHPSCRDIKPNQIIPRESRTIQSRDRPQQI